MATKPSVEKSDGFRQDTETTPEAQNLDYLCAKCGRRIFLGATIKTEPDKSKADSYLANALGVLREQGIYAFYLYLKYKYEKGLPKVKDETLKLLCDEVPGLVKLTESEKKQQKDQDEFFVAERLSSDLDSLFLARQILEQALIYSRYHVRSTKVES